MRFAIYSLKIRPESVVFDRGVGYHDDSDARWRLWLPVAVCEVEGEIENRPHFEAEGMSMHDLYTTIDGQLRTFSAEQVMADDAGDAVRFLWRDPKFEG